MSPSERKYNRWIIAFGAFFLVALIGLGVLFASAIVIGKPSGYLAFLMSYAGIHGIAFLVTAMLNLHNNRLLFIPTIIQILLALTSFYGIPLSIWGIRLLRQSALRRSDRTASEGRA